MKARKLTAAVAVLALLITSLLPLGAFAQDAAILSAAADSGSGAQTTAAPAAGSRVTGQTWIEPITPSEIFYVGGQLNNVTQIPAESSAWPKQAPSDLEQFYVWSHSSILPYVETSIEYWGYEVYMSDQWYPQPPRYLVYDSRLKDITGYGDMGRTITIDRPRYLYFAYYLDDDSWPEICYAALVQPVAAAVEELRVVSPEEPANGFALTDSVVLEPVWTVGTTDGSAGGGSFTPVPGLHGWPNLAALQWGIKGNPDPGQVVTDPNNLTPCVYMDQATLVPPYTGGDVTYTAALTVSPATTQTQYYIHATDPPAEITIHWDPDSTPNPTPPPTPTPKPEPPSDKPVLENELPESVTRADFYVGGAQNNVSVLPIAENAWPKTPPEDLATQYAWTMDDVVPHVTAAFEYGHMEVATNETWCSEVPKNGMLGLHFITGSKYGITVKAVEYLYFLFYDEPGGNLISCYAAKLQPVAASVTGIELMFPDTQPEDGFALDDTVMILPKWSVGITNGGSHITSFTPIEGLSGCPAGAAVHWSASPALSEVISASGNRTIGTRAGTLVPPEGGGAYTYSVRAVSTGGSHQTVNAFNIVPTSTPPTIEVAWQTDRGAQLPPIESVPDSVFDVRVEPNPISSGAILTGLPLGTSPADAPTVGGLLDSISVPDGFELQVRKGSNALSPEDVVGTGCTINVLDSSGAVAHQATIVTRGDVLGTGVLSLSQLTRLAHAYVQAAPLVGPYQIAGGMLSDTNSVTLTGLVMLADMMRGQA